MGDKLKLDYAKAHKSAQDYLTAAVEETLDGLSESPPKKSGHRFVKIDLGTLGETTCINGTLKQGFCKMLRADRFGQRMVCQVFDKELRDDSGIPSGPGLLQRLPECLTAEVLG